MIKHFKTALQHITRAPYQAFAAIGICTITFYFASVFAVVAVGSTVLLQYFETRPQVTAFFKNEANMDQINAVKAKLEASGLASNIKYVSQEEALSIYREQNQKDPLLLEMVTADILPASLEIEANNPEALKQLAGIVKTEPIIDEVLFQEDIVSALTTWTKAVRTVGFFLISTFGILTLVIILVIIGMKIALKREEIEILTLIGATRGYIRMPFIFEGLIYGLVGAFMAWVFTLITILYSIPFLVTFLAGLPLLPIPIWFYVTILISVMSFGAVLGTLGSFMAVRRYLE